MYIFIVLLPACFLKAVKTTQGLVDQRVSILKGKENKLGFASPLVHRSKILRTSQQRNAMCLIHLFLKTWQIKVNGELKLTIKKI